MVIYAPYTCLIYDFIYNSIYSRIYLYNHSKNANKWKKGFTNFKLQRECDLKISISICMFPQNSNFSSLSTSLLNTTKNRHFEQKEEILQVE